MLHQEKELPNNSGRPFSCYDLLIKRQNDYCQEVTYFRLSVRKDLVAACTVCVCVSVSQFVKLLVNAFCGVHIFLTQRQIGAIAPKWRQ